jgi:hypothetical protein
VGSLIILRTAVASHATTGGDPAAARFRSYVHVSGNASSVVPWITRSLAEEDA